MNKPFKPVGVCIYCGVTEGLTKEHIIPFGLNGDLLLPQSSCKKCNALTSLFEQKVLREHMNDARMVSGLQTRNKKERPKSIAMDFIRVDESIKQVDVPNSDAFALLIMPIYLDALFAYDLSPSRGSIVREFELIPLGNNLETVLAKNDAIGVSGKTRIRGNAFAKMLAKIAYSFYIGVNGVFPMDESPALALIKGDVEDANNWVGTTFRPLSVEKAKGLHRLSTKDIVKNDGSLVQIVLIQLFAQKETCTYEVVVRAERWREFLIPLENDVSTHSRPTLA